MILNQRILTNNRKEICEKQSDHDYEDTGRERDGEKEQRCKHCGKTRWVPEDTM